MLPTPRLSAAPSKNSQSSVTVIEPLFLASRSRTAAESTALNPDSHHGGSFLAATDFAPTTQSDYDGGVGNRGQGSGNLAVGLLAPYQYPAGREEHSVAKPVHERDTGLGTPSPVPQVALAFGSFRPNDNTSDSEAPQPLYITREAAMKVQGQPGGIHTRPGANPPSPSVPPGYGLRAGSGWAVDGEGGAQSTSYPPAENSIHTQQSSWQMLLSGGGAGMQNGQQDASGQHTLTYSQGVYQKFAAPTTPPQDILLVQQQIPLDEGDDGEGYDDFDDILATLMS